MEDKIKKAFEEYDVHGKYFKSKNQINLISGDLLCEWDISPDMLLKHPRGHKVTHMLQKVFVISKLNLYPCYQGGYSFEFQEAFLYFFVLKMLGVKLDIPYNNMYISHFKDENPLDNNPNITLEIK